MKSTLNLVSFVLVTFLNQVHACDPNLQPVIGILTQDLNDTEKYPDTYFLSAGYVKFIEMFGGRVVPILPNKPDSYYEFLATRLSGVLLPGGAVDIYSGFYHDKSKFFYDYSLKLADTKYQIFPIMGTCLGFEMLATLAAKESDVMSKTDSDYQLSNIELTEYGKQQSKLFNSAPDWLIQGIQSSQVASNYHHYSLLKSTYDNNADIKKIFHNVANSYDRENVEYVSIMESKKYPLIAVQHHPEKNLFEWSPTSLFDHSFIGSAYGQYFGDYFLQLARTSCQRFESEEELDPYLIYNFPVTYTQGMFPDKDEDLTQMYFFPTNPDDKKLELDDSPLEDDSE